MERLNGISYYRQTRKCGKDHCHCYTDKEHGPYWYANDGGKIRYIGKTLPDDINYALLVREESRNALRETMDNMRAQIDELHTVSRLIWDYLAGEALADREIRLVEAATGLTLRLV